MKLLALTTFTLATLLPLSSQAAESNLARTQLNISHSSSV